MQGGGRVKTRRWTAAFSKHGKRRGKMWRAWNYWRGLLGKPPHCNEMMDAAEFWSQRHKSRGRRRNG